MSNDYLVYGSGGHAKIILELLTKQGFKIIGVFDDNPNCSDIYGIPVLHGYQPEYAKESSLIIGIGNNSIREKLTTLLGHKYGKAIASSAQVSAYAEIGEGTVVLQNTVIQSSSKIGKHCIINMGALIDHDTKVHTFAHIGPNAVVCAYSEIGEGAFIGAGAVISYNVKIGKDVKIPPGIVVTSDVLEQIPSGH